MTWWKLFFYLQHCPRQSAPWKTHTLAWCLTGCVFGAPWLSCMITFIIPTLSRGTRGINWEVIDLGSYHGIQSSMIQWLYIDLFKCDWPNTRSLRNILYSRSLSRARPMAVSHFNPPDSGILVFVLSPASHGRCLKSPVTPASHGDNASTRRRQGNKGMHVVAQPGLGVSDYNTPRGITNMAYRITNRGTGRWSREFAIVNT